MDKEGTGRAGQEAIPGGVERLVGDTHVWVPLVRFGQASRGLRSVAAGGRGGGEEVPSGLTPHPDSRAGSAVSKQKKTLALR